MSTGSLPFAYNDFHGGLNTYSAPYLLEDNESRDLQNVQGTTAGAIVKRTGLVTFASPAVTFKSLFPLESTGSPFLIGTGGTSIYSVSAGGSVTDIHGAATLTNNLPWSFVSGPVISGQGPLYGMDGTDTPLQWTGSGNVASWTATDSGGAVPNGKYSIYWQNQVFVAGVGSTPSRVYWSAIADPTGWNPANLKGAGFMDFDPNDGQPITGIGVAGPYVLVGKARKLWVITSPANATARLISNNVGIVSHRSIAAGPEGTFFLNEDRGVFLTNGSKVTPISDKIIPTLNQVDGLRNIAAGVEYNGHYYLSVSLKGTNNDTILDYDSLLGTWWKHNIGSNQFAIWHPTGSSPSLYSAKATSAIVDQCFVPSVYTDNGSPMTWFWRGPWQSPTFYRRRRFPTPWFRKRLRQVRLEGFGTVDFSIAKDFAGLETLIRANCLANVSGGTYGAVDGTVYGAADGTLYGSPSVTRARFFSLGVANAFSLVFSATSNTPDTVLEYTMMLTDRKDMVTT